MNKLAEANDRFRKTIEGFVCMMVPNVPNIFRNLKALEFSHQAIAEVAAFNFPDGDESDRNSGTVEVRGHIFRWEICYIPPGKTIHNERDFVLEPVSDKRQLRMYVPTND